MNMMKNKLFWTIGSIAAFFMLVITLIPKPIDMDLDKIGMGQKAVVFVYDLNLAVSNQQVIEMNKAKEIIAKQAIFLIAKTGDPDGEAFKSQHHAQSADLLFFNGEGELYDRHIGLLSAEELLGKLTDN